MNKGIDTVSYKLDKLINATQSAHTEIREYIRNIRSPAYMEKDFITALKKELSEFEEQTGISVKLDTTGEFTYEKLKPNIRLNMLNVIKEALNNIRKHADAKNAGISISVVQNQLCVVIEDDGKGFEPSQSHNNIKTRFGLDIMQERATEMGGRIDIRSAAGKGCRIELIVPIEEEEEDSKDANEIDVGR